MARELPSSVGAGALWFEQALMHANDDPDDTLQVALTHYELTLISYGLSWLATFYGAELVEEIREKFGELLDAQEFCKCPNCTAKRAEEAGDGPSV